MHYQAKGGIGGRESGYLPLPLRFLPLIRDEMRKKLRRRKKRKEKRGKWSMVGKKRRWEVKMGKVKGKLGKEKEKGRQGMENERKGKEKRGKMKMGGKGRENKFLLGY